MEWQLIDCSQMLIFEKNSNELPLMNSKCRKKNVSWHCFISPNYLNQVKQPASQSVSLRSSPHSSSIERTTKKTPTVVIVKRWTNIPLDIFPHYFLQFGLIGVREMAKMVFHGAVIFNSISTVFKLSRKQNYKSH